MSAACPNLELKNLTFLGQKNELLTTGDILYDLTNFSKNASRQLLKVSPYFFLTDPQ